MKVKLCAVSLLVVFVVSGCVDNRRQSVVSVFGTGTVMAQPDMLQMTISLSRVEQTTRAAQEAVAAMVRQALGILKEAEIADADISTASLRFSSEYEWNGSRRVLVGQKAEQSIAFTINGINAGTETVSKIIDSLIQINGIELNQINFNVKDTAELFARSRELAYQKALEKANQYAALSGLKIARTLRVAEEGSPQIVPVNNRMLPQMKVAYSGEAAADGSTVLPAGEMEISSKILVEFLLR
jgi:uncharacterized protein YggE